MIIDEHFEDKVMACLLGSTDFCATAAQHLKPKYFTNPVRHNVAKLGIDFYTHYGALVSGPAFVTELKELVSSKVIKTEDMGLYGDEFKKLKKIDISDWKWVLEKLIVFIKNKETKAFIEAAVKKWMPKNDFKSIEKEMAKIASITTHQEVKPYEYWDRDSIIQRAKRREIEKREIDSGKSIGISTGIPMMDKTLNHGGWFRKELYIIMAPPKVGKTMALLWFGNTAALQGFNVTEFTFETAKDVLADRLDALNTETETKLLMSKNFYVAKRLASKPARGHYTIFEYPTKTCTVTEIERQVAKLETEHGIVTDFLVVDYGDLMKPARRYDNPLSEQAAIFEDLRGLAGRFGIPVLTATQVNRVGAGKALITGTDVAGTWEKIMVADCIISLSQTKEEKRENKMRIHFAEARNNESATMMIGTKYGYGRFFGEFIEEEE
jgi:KaiC/GvpD/RAD55 family RecA-like ATPase